jgi:hypothetical protein
MPESETTRVIGQRLRQELALCRRPPPAIESLLVRLALSEAEPGGAAVPSGARLAGAALPRR